MPRVAIQVDYTEASPGYFDWLKASIAQRLDPFGLEALVFIAKSPVTGPTVPFSDQTLYNFTTNLVNQATIKQKAEQSGDWFVHLLITSRHENSHLGLMYDVGFDSYYRQGCAVFARRVRDLTGMDYDPFARVLLRVVLHELGHCFNLAHTTDQSLMAQTEDIQNYYGPSWIQHIQYLFAPGDINYLTTHYDVCKPGTNQSFIGIMPDTALAKQQKQLSLKARAFTDNPGKSFEKGDAVSLAITIKNNSRAAIQIISPLDPNIDNCRISLQPPGEQSRVLQFPVVGCGVTQEVLTIAGKTSKHFALHLFADKSGYLFNKAGDYEAKIFVLVATGKWINTTVCFKIRRSRVQAEKLNKILVSTPLLRAMSFGLEINNKNNQSVLAILKKLPACGLKRSIYWQLYYHLKNNLKSTADLAQNKKHTKKLLTVIDQLHPLETSGIRKGKLLLEKNKALNFLKPIGMKKQTVTATNTIHQYKRYCSTYIQIKAAVSAQLPQKLLWSFLIILTGFVCGCKKITDANGSAIYGTLRYTDIQNNTKPVFAGQKVQAFFNNDVNPFMSFVTADSGRYNFNPIVQGTYSLIFFYTDSVVQFNSKLVEKQDIDTLRANRTYAVAYTATGSSWDIKNPGTVKHEDILLKNKETGVVLTLQDANQNPLADVRVCIYSNQQYAILNSPYCGGCVAYLSSDVNGKVVFVGLQAQAYYINARGKVGVVSINNQWSDDMKTTGTLVSGQLLPKNIILK